MIAEAAPAAYDIANKTGACIFEYTEPVSRTVLTDQELWDGWYSDFFDYIESNQDIIRVVAYINAAWDTAESPQFQCTGDPVGGPNCPSAYWGNSQLQSNPFILNNFAQEISQPHFLTGADMPAPAPFDTPDLSPQPLVYEAEYAESSFGWFEWGPWGLFHGVLALPQPTPLVTATDVLTASNGREVQLLNYLDWEKPSIIFDNIDPGHHTVTVTYRTVPISTTSGVFSLWLNDTMILTQTFTNTNGVYTQAAYDLHIPPRATLSIQLDSVGTDNNAHIMWIDKIQLSPNKLYLPLMMTSTS